MSRIDQQQQLLRQLATGVAQSISKRYKVEVGQALSTVWELWSKDEALWNQVQRTPNIRQLLKTRAYKEASDRAKTTIYYGLRRYRTAPLEEGLQRLCELSAGRAAVDDPQVLAARDQVIQSHVSTRERLEDAHALVEFISKVAPDARRILDVGSGVQPLLFPFEGQGAGIERYVALDRDSKSVEAIRAWSKFFAPGRLEAHEWRLSEGFARLADEPSFDLALALKFVPVVARQERERLPILGAVPADRFLVTGAREAMVKRQSISRREEHALRDFAELAGFPVLQVFETASEVGLLLDSSRTSQAPSHRIRDR